MPNSKQREWERRALRIWSDRDQDWVAPPFIEGDQDSGPEFHNASTYSNWHCRCLECKADHRVKHRKDESSKQSSEPASAPPSSGASSAGSGATEKGSDPRDLPTGTSGSVRESTSP